MIKTNVFFDFTDFQEWCRQPDTKPLLTTLQLLDVFGSEAQTEAQRSTRYLHGSIPLDARRLVKEYQSPDRGRWGRRDRDPLVGARRGRHTAEADCRRQVAGGALPYRAARRRIERT